jgi:[protein-PII] uridylyltransferase
MVQSEPHHNLCVYLEDNKQKIFREFLAGGLLSQLHQDLKKLIDDCVLQIWSMTVKAQNSVLIAIGGYGRAEVFPYSDVSLLLLTSDHDATIQKLHLENFVKLCSDAGLTINLSVKSVADCLASAGQDILFQTSLLDLRFLDGSQHLFDRFNQQLLSKIDPQAFFYARQKEIQQRYIQYQETPYALEPSCKESPGGLRDLEVVLWISRVAALGKTWQSLVDKNLLTAYELRELLRNQKLLQRIRAHLHLLTNQKQDTLLFELQPLLAERLGFAYGDHRQNSEQLMHEYYLAAKRVTQINAILMLEIEGVLFPKEFQVKRQLNADFYERQGLLEIARDDLFQLYPEKILETFWLSTQTPDVRGLSSKTLRALYLARNKMDANWRSDARNHACFLRIMQQTSASVSDTLKLMNQTGVLGRYLLNFRQVMGKMPHDSFLEFNYEVQF